MRTLLVLGALIAVLCASPAGAQQEAAAAVRDARVRSNEAIAARSLEQLAPLFRDDVHVTAGSGRSLPGRDSVLAQFAVQFADSAFLGYVRETARVEASVVLPLAAEYGEWVGRWRRDDGIQETRGSYLAMWRRDETGWRLQSELYVTLTCGGSQRCRP